MEVAALNPLAFGYAFGILCGLTMLLLGIVWRLGYMKEALQLTQPFCPGLSSSFKGILVGVLEGAVEGFVAGYLVALLYNLFA